MKRILLGALGFIIVFVVFLNAIFGGRISLTPFTGSLASEESSTELDPISITLWSEQAELFFEYPPFVAGHASIFAAHLTDLRNFRPVITGTVEIRMITLGQPALSFLASAPLRAGIFTPSVYARLEGRSERQSQIQSQLAENNHIGEEHV